MVNKITHTEAELNEALSIEKAKVFFRPGSAFIASILAAVKTVWDTDTPTAATDGVSLFMNPNFFMSMSTAEREFLLCHEGWHVAFEHSMRLEGRDPEDWNIAADLVINLMLKDDNYAVPSMALLDEKYRGMGTEQVYEEIKGNTEDLELAMKDIKPTSKGSSGSQYEASGILANAAAAAKQDGSYGNLPGEVRRTLDELFNPVLPWQVLLGNYFDDYAKTEHSFTKPNKRFFPDMLLPSLHGEVLAEIAIAVDSSGSVGPEEFKAFLSEIDEIRTTLNPELTSVIDFDTEIHNEYHLGPDDSTTDVKFSGGGGTILAPVFDHYKEKPPTVLLIFSDLYCREADEDPGYPVLWVVIDNPNANVNFGEIIHYDSSRALGKN